MHPKDISPATPFITRWTRSSAAERANYQLFLSELCDLLGVGRPNPSTADDSADAYVFERSVRFDHADGTHSTGRIDLYKRNCFVLEAKQGSAANEDAGASLFARPATGKKRGTAVRDSPAWDAAMFKARGQAEQYVRALPASEGNPPFVLVVDVGHTIELYADFSRLGKTYTPFPDSRSHRIALSDLTSDDTRRQLASIWTDPLSLDPSRHSAKVTRKVAEKLAKLARSLESSGHHPESVAHFLMRCLFTFFAEDARLIERTRDEEQPFTQLLKGIKGHADQFVPMIQEVWQRMDAGGFSTALRRKLKHFNGKLFKESVALPLNAQQLDLLIEAGDSDWSDVEPAIFGTLLERALDERERHKLGAHYTPRAYVERLVLPTVIEPLREQFDAAKAAAFTLNFQGKPEDARKAIDDFLVKLASTTVLDPACGSGNFLYVTMEHMKRLEGEARDLLRQLGETQQHLERGGRTVDPHQFLGLEINPRAVAIAELVLWIGYLKWHLRTLGHAPSEPLLKDFHNIREQDAVLAYDKRELVTDDRGKPVTRWDGRTTKTSPVTGEEIPDETARVPVYRYVNPRKAEWPKADYVVGNPPFIGNKRMRFALGDGYVEALRAAHDELDETSDFVMFWWDHAARLLRKGLITQFGFITTNSITHPFNRKVVLAHLAEQPPVSLIFAIPDHPWVDTVEGAAVRIAMTTAARGEREGHLATVIAEEPGEEGAQLTLREQSGKIAPDLVVGTTVTSSVGLAANDGISFMGVTLVGDGFKLSADEAGKLGYGARRDVVKPYLSGKELTQRAQDRYVIDLFGQSEAEMRKAHPALYQRLLERVKPEREQNQRESYRERWWIFGEPRTNMRSALQKLSRYIATIETGKHRAFIFLRGDVMPDHSLFAIALDDAFYLGVLSARPHLLWSLHAGATLEDRPRWRNVTCFEPFPFPDCTEAKKKRIRELGEALDAHRKRQQAAHAGLTITEMYNVLEKLRAGSELSAKERIVHEKGLVSVLKQIHDDLDAAALDAYGWPADLSDEQLLAKLVELNHHRSSEERRGVVRWLRPEFQNPTGAKAAVQGDLAIAASAGEKAKTKKLTWPATLAEQAQALRAALQSHAAPATAEEIARLFTRAPGPRVRELLDTLRSLGQVRAVNGERFAA